MGSARGFLVAGALLLCIAAGDAKDAPVDAKRGTRLSETTVVLMLTGDNLLGGRMKEAIARNGKGYPYQKVSYVLRGADLVFGNLECPITDYPYATRGKSAGAIKQRRDFVFKASPEYSASVLADAGFDVLSLANNHAMDYQGQGLLQTIEELTKYNLIHVGAGRNSREAASARIVVTKGMRIGFLAYSMIVPSQSAAGSSVAGINAHGKGFSKSMAAAIQQLRAKTDIVVVSYHWGEEGNHTPLQYQREVARQAVDAGAHVVVGHHPHRIQGIEFRKDGVIFYSLGNFLFPGRSTLVESFVGRVEFSGARIASVRILPVWVRHGRPEPSTDLDLIRKIQEVCQPFAVDLTRSGEWLLVAKAD